jgi:predicted transcriptional regulator
MRDELITTVESNPGIHFRALQRLLDCSTSTVDHHVRNTLEVNDVLIHNYRRVFHEAVDNNLYPALAALNHEAHKDILAFVAQAEPVTRSEISDEVDLASSTVTYHVTTLVDDDLLAVTQHGRTKYYQVTNASRTAVKLYGKSLLEHATKGFIDLWD